MKPGNNFPAFPYGSAHIEGFGLIDFLVEIGNKRAHRELISEINCVIPFHIFPLSAEQAVQLPVNERGPLLEVADPYKNISLSQWVSFQQRLMAELLI